MIALFCMLIAVAVVSMIFLIAGRTPPALAIGGPFIFILIMIFLIIKTSH